MLRSRTRVSSEGNRGPVIHLLLFEPFLFLNELLFGFITQLLFYIIHYHLQITGWVRFPLLHW